MRIRREEGLSLVEALVAIAIFGMLLVVLLTMMQQENNILRDSVEMLSARLKANKTMETLKTRPFDELKSYSSLIVSELKHMTIHVLVSDFDDSKALKKIVVTVRWFDQRGHERQCMLTTLRSRYSLSKINRTALETGVKGGR
jgi:hypothetical protein